MDDELDLIKHFLTRMPERLGYTDGDISNKIKELKLEENTIRQRFFKIIHLYAILYVIYKMDDDCDSTLDQLEDCGINHLIEPAVPGICLVYLNAIMSSKIINSKLNDIGSLIITISSRQKIFGTIGHYVLQVA